MSNIDSQIKTFLAVARLGSFRRAADELYVTQAAVTTRIKGLEDYLGFAVFHRHRRGDPFNNVDCDPTVVLDLE